MTFEEARRQIVAELHEANGFLNDQRFSARMKDASSDIPFEEFGLDSLSTMEICMAVEEKVGIEIDLGDLVRFPSVNALARHIAESASQP
jgi:acyl carrier protein